MRISQAQTVYREAALQQFLDRGAFISMLDQFRPLFINAICGLQSSIDARLASIQETGITRQDLLWQNRLIGHLDKILARLDTYRNNPDNIEANFRDYLAGFSPNVQDVLAKFDFDNIIKRMVESN